MLYGDHTYPLIVVSILLSIQLLNHYVVHLKLICQLYFIKKKKLRTTSFLPPSLPFLAKENKEQMVSVSSEENTGLAFPWPQNLPKGMQEQTILSSAFIWPVTAPAPGAQEGRYRSKSETRLKSTFSSLSLWPSATGVRGPAWALPGPAPRQFFCCSTPISRQLWPGSDRSAVGNSKSGQARALAEPRVFIQCLLLPGRGGRTLSRSTETTSQAVEQVAIYSCQRESKQQLFSH